MRKLKCNNCNDKLEPKWAGQADNSLWKKVSKPKKNKKTGERSKIFKWIKIKARPTYQIRYKCRCGEQLTIDRKSKSEVLRAANILCRRERNEN